MLDTQLQQSLAQITNDGHKAEGVAVGKAVADYILALRANDGSSAPPTPFVFGTAPGDYQSTPPNFPKQPQFTHWARVAPFALERANQFRPGPPPELTSERYADALNEVKALGIANGTMSSPDEALTGRFWNGAIQNYWNEIAQTAALAHELTTADSARLFALLNLSIADSVIAFYDAKYTYNFWRPVSAIRAADTDDNPDYGSRCGLASRGRQHHARPGLPRRPRGHQRCRGNVLRSSSKRSFRFPRDLGSSAGVERSFTQIFNAAEATLSRIFAGVHFRTDLTTVAGWGCGRRFRRRSLLTRRHRATIPTTTDRLSHQTGARHGVRSMDLRVVRRAEHPDGYSPQLDSSAELCFQPQPTHADRSESCFVGASPSPRVARLRIRPARVPVPGLRDRRRESLAAGQSDAADARRTDSLEASRAQGPRRPR